MRRLAPLSILSAIVAAGLLFSACGDDAAPAAKTETPALAASAEQSAVMPADAPPQEEEAAASIAGSDAAAADDTETRACSADIGQDAARRLVERCIAVSPATHPPCNVQNACALIQSEIDRSCAMYGPGETRPSECSA